MEYCDNCKYLSLTEKEQKKLSMSHLDHKCKLLNKRVFHLGQHPKLPKLEDCPLKESKR